MVAMGEQVFKASGIIQGSCGGCPELPALCSLAGGGGGVRGRGLGRGEGGRVAVRDHSRGRSL